MRPLDSPFQCQSVMLIGSVDSPSNNSVLHNIGEAKAKILHLQAHLGNTTKISREQCHV